MLYKQEKKENLTFESNMMNKKLISQRDTPKSEATDYIIHLLPEFAPFYDLDYACVDLSWEYYTSVLELLSKLPGKIWIQYQDGSTTELTTIEDIEVYYKDHFIRLSF